jgi:hypothetical protein
MTARVVSDCIKAGYTVERADSGQIRDYWFDECPHQNPVQKELPDPESVP